MTPTEQELLAELRQLNEELKALRRIAEGPLLAELVEVILDLRKMFARATGWTVVKK